MVYFFPHQINSLLISLVSDIQSRNIIKELDPV